MTQFIRSEFCHVLIATDMVCGVDISRVSLVINYDIPSIKDYIFRLVFVICMMASS